MIDVVNNGFIKFDMLSTSDFYQCLDLLVKSFPQSGDDLYKMFNFFFENVPQLKCLVLKENEQCIGILCIVDRTIKYSGVSCRVAGLSYLAIKPSHQNAHAMAIIKKHMFNYIKNNSDLSLGFSRKVMDNYWYPYGFRGVTNFGEISLSLKPIFSSTTKVNSRASRAHEISLLSKFYDDTHSDMLGPLEREMNLWQYYLQKCKLMNIDIVVMELDKEPIGYYILDGNVVLEIGYNFNLSKQIFMHLVSELKDLGYDEIIFKIGKEHPLIKMITRYEHSIKTRFVWRGGHIVRITSVHKFFEKVRSVLESRAINSNLNDFDFCCNLSRFSYAHNRLSITSINQEKKNIRFEEFEWVKLIFGACTPTHLNGYEGDKNESILRILFPICSPQFFEIDQY